MPDLEWLREQLYHTPDYAVNCSSNDGIRFTLREAIVEYQLQQEFERGAEQKLRARERAAVDVNGAWRRRRRIHQR